jgi:prophage maintenance system killer protein
MSAPNSLVKQLEKARLSRALDIVESLCEHKALLTTGELARINQVITGKSEDPWRQGPVTLQHSSGRTFTYSLVADPHIQAREKLHQATERCLSQDPTDVVEAAIDLYCALVLSHVFKDGNRRTAAAAAHYIFNRNGVRLSGTAIHEIGMGDLRDPQEAKALRDTIRQMAAFIKRR